MPITLGLVCAAAVRERQVFGEMSAGECSKVIGGNLKISQHTVDTYKKRIYRKLGFCNQADLLKFLLCRNRPHQITSV